MNVSDLLSVLMKMSFEGSIMILSVILIRAIFMNRLPKKTFVYLWIVTAVVLLVPVRPQSPVSVFNLIGKIEIASSDERSGESVSPDSGDIIDSPEINYEYAEAELAQSEYIQNRQNVENIQNSQNTQNFTVNPDFKNEAEKVILKTGVIPYIIFSVWICGALGSAVYFLFSYRKWRREFSQAIPCFEEFVCEQIKQFRISRKIRVLISDRITSPLTYGIFKPVILLPKFLSDSSSDDKMYFKCVLVHEFVHIRHFDAVKKFLFTLCLCVHWFNPVVWLMAACSNRDIELACDEEVIENLGEDMKKAYSLVLIDSYDSKRIMHFSGFSRYALKERICAIMKYRKTTILSVVLAIGIIIGTVSVFGSGKLDEDKETAAKEQVKKWRNNAIEQIDVVRESLVKREEEIFINNTETEEDILSTIISLEEQSEAERIAALEAEARAKDAEISVKKAILEAQIQEYRTKIESERVLLEEQAKIAEMEVLIETKLTELQEQIEAGRIAREKLLTEIETLTKQYGAFEALKAGLTDFNWPLSAEYDKLSTVFGYYYIVNAESEPHTGIDIPAEHGTDVYASNSGTVVTAEYDHKLGNYIVIEHDGEKSTLYAHLSEINVEVGDNVEKMEVIGKVGSTGYSTGNHLHFEILIDGTPVDPMLYISAE